MNIILIFDLDLPSAISLVKWKQMMLSQMLILYTLNFDTEVKITSKHILKMPQQKKLHMAYLYSDRLQEISNE